MLPMLRKTIVLAWAVCVFAAAGNPLHAGDAGERVTHYAFLSTGPSGGPLAASYWHVNQRMYEVLKEYGYPDEAIYRFSEFGATQGPSVIGRSTLSNFRKTFAHLAQILKPDDHVLILLVGNGSPYGSDFVHSLIGGGLTATELKEMVDRLPAKELTLVMHPCFSGGFLPKLSAPGRVVVTSTNDKEVNACPWAEAFEEALDLNSRGSAPSIKDAYNAALEPSRKKYGSDLKEHPLLDDNGDGVGHYGAEKIVGGDGTLAAGRFLGDRGRPLHFSSGAIAQLRELNAPLRAAAPAKFQQAFSAESVFLGALGGYEHDVGANSTRSELHLAYAQSHPPHVVAENLLTKYRLQFERQAQKGKEAADKFYADASSRLAAYEVDLGDPGANRTDTATHLQWAQRQSVQKLRDALETKLHTVMAGLLDIPK